MYLPTKRIFDLISSLLVLFILLPVLLLIALINVVDGRGRIFYSQVRVGKDGKLFKILKFRSMHPNSAKSEELPIGDDQSITAFGGFLRKSKLDELPQLLNVISGNMSVVGPRPEVESFVKLYSEEQRYILSVKPGLTDIASIIFINEYKILCASKSPKDTYIQEIMPEKLRLSLLYIEKRSFWFDIKLIFITLGRIIFRSQNHLSIANWHFE